MNKKVIRIVALLVLAGAVLTGCAAGVRAESTPGVTVTDDYVYVAYMNSIYQLDRLNGSQVSIFPEKASANLAMYAPPVAENGYVYFGDLANEFHKATAGNLTQMVWTFDQARGWFQAKPALAGDIVIAPSTDRNVYAIRTESGNLDWVYEGEYAFIAEPVIVGDKIIVSAQDRHVLVLDRISGQELYRTEMTGAVLSAPLYDVETGSVFVGSLGREMISFDLETGAVNWVYGEGKDLSTVWATPILLDNQLIFTDTSGKIIALDPKTGEELWQNHAGGRVIAGATLVEDKGFLVAREDGTMTFYALTQGGDWTVTVPGNIYSKPIVGGNQIFVPVVKADALLYTYSTSGVPG
ncbi:MAG: PQQ-binding-like beta-propeller repeat protein, partial [Chloroflexi bacterium]|nr:PQQ-binding-like beta-propeller repeat protein [Chloroflexota bacterium]